MTTEGAPGPSSPPSAPQAGALWLLYRLLEVRHPVLAVCVAAVVALCLLAVPELLHQVGLGLGVELPAPDAPRPPR